MASALAILFQLAAFFLGIFVIWKLFRAKDFDEEKVLDLVAVGILGGLVAGRGVFVFLNWPNYVSSPLGVLNILDGGINLEAAFLSFLLFTFYFLLFFKWPFFPSLDYLALGGVVASLVLSTSEILVVTAAGFGQMKIYALFLLKFLILGLAVLVFKRFYRSGGILALFLISTLSPILILTGGLVFVMVNGKELAGDFVAGFRQGFQSSQYGRQQPNFTTRKKTA